MSAAKTAKSTSKGHRPSDRFRERFSPDAEKQNPYSNRLADVAPEPNGGEQDAAQSEARPPLRMARFIESEYREKDYQTSAFTAEQSTPDRLSGQVYPLDVEVFEDIWAFMRKEGIPRPNYPMAIRAALFIYAHYRDSLPEEVLRAACYVAVRTDSRYAKAKRDFALPPGSTEEPVITGKARKGKGVGEDYDA